MNNKIIKTTILIAFSLSTMAIKAQHPPPPPFCPIDEPDTTTGVFIIVEKFPTYIGGLNAMFKFISDSLHYPNHDACYTINL